MENYERCPKCNSKWNEGEITMQVCVSCGYSYADELKGIETGKKKDDGFSIFAWIIAAVIMLIIGASLTFLLMKQGMPDIRAKGLGMGVWFIGTGILKNRIQRWVKK